MSWRSCRDPFGVWVSEVMLQQTRVETVERYWSAFLARFPTVEALASASEDAVLESWSGLGYYRRAKLLHRGAKYVSEALAGVLPEEVDALRRVPGIGPYTAGAIASIAFDRAAALVDGNVARVLSRVCAVEDPRAQSADAPDHWALAQAVVEHGSPRVLAQALMELGATICTPRGPSCDRCPVAGLCKAHATGKVDAIPAPKKRREVPVERWWALAGVQRDRVLLGRRPEPGLLAGLWCLPLVAVEDPAPTRSHEVVGHIRHVFTHRIWEIDVVRTSPARAKRALESLDTVWVTLGQRPAGGLPTLTVKLLASLAS